MSWSRIPTPFPQESRIPTFCHHHPEYRFLSQSGITCPNFGESRFSGKSQIPYPINVSRIPHCILVKFRIPGVPFQDEPHFVSGLGSLSLSPRNRSTWIKPSKSNKHVNKEHLNEVQQIHLCDYMTFKPVLSPKIPVSRRLIRELKQRRFWAPHVNRKWGPFHFKAPWRSQICISKCLNYYRDKLS